MSTSQTTHVFPGTSTSCTCPSKETEMAKKKRQCPKQLENVVTKIEGRREDLIDRQRCLRNKIVTLERSIPALMAYNMWMAGENCQNAPYCKLREMMKKFSPSLDPTEKLLAELKNTVKELNEETTELHNKIITADIQLEETEMELESLESINKEMLEKAVTLEDEVQLYDSPSIHSIHSNDLLCLSKIRQLAKEELALKNSIKELEDKEAVFRKQMEQLLTSREFQNATGTGKRIIKKSQEHDSQGHQHSKKKITSKQQGTAQTDIAASTTTVKHRMKIDQSEKDKLSVTAEKKSTWISSWLGTQQSPILTERPPALKKMEKTSALTDDDMEACICPGKKKPLSDASAKYWKKGNVSPCKNCVSPAICPTVLMTKSCSCSSHRPSVSAKSQKNLPKSQKLCSKNPLCQPPACVNMETRTCSLIPSTRSGSCRCNCKGKCARGLSSAVCNCGAAQSYPLDKGYQPIATGKSKSRLNTADSTSDDEFCECCSCGCDDSDQ